MEEVVAASPPATTPPAARPRWRAPLILLVLLLLAATAAWLGWRYFANQPKPSDAIAALTARTDTLMRGVAQLRGSADTLRARLDDGEKVDASVRQQLLALGERMRLAEDALANLADHRLSGHDALALDDAESLLTLGGERYRLFHDAPAAIAAYRLADTTLAGVDDAAFSTVRQSILGEIAALGDLHAADPAPLVAKLRDLRTQIAQWQAPAPAPPPPLPAADASRLSRLFAAFVQVRHDSDAPAQMQLRDSTLARELVVLDLREAQAAALARDAGGYGDALAAARAQINASYDASTPAVAAALHELDALAQARLAPAEPAALGAALKELRNLRATHALSTAHAKPAEVKK